jgi:hypothetical protein
MVKTDNQLLFDTASNPSVARTRSEENAAYMENWAAKYAAQIAAHNEMLQSHGLWNDEFRVF